MGRLDVSLGKMHPPKVDRPPCIETTTENNVRKDFFEHHDFISLRDNLPNYLKSVATFGYISGWRISEILCLEWAQVDRKNGIVTLDPGTLPIIIKVGVKLTLLLLEK